MRRVVRALIEMKIDVDDDNEDFEAEVIEDDLINCINIVDASVLQIKDMGEES